MKILSFLSVCVLCMCAAIPFRQDYSVQATGHTYYFASNGSDSYTTTQAQNQATPWKTLSHLTAVMSSLVNGDTIKLNSNDTFYSPNIELLKGLNFAAYGSGNKPIINGFVNVASWTSVGSGIYESNTLATGSTVNMVSINGNEYAMGRYPNADATNKGYLSFESHATGTITDNQKPSVIDNTLTGAQLVVRVSHFVLGKATISGVSGNTISYGGSFTGTVTNGYGYFIQNSASATVLDQFGEWYYNPSTHKIRVYFGSAGPTGNTVQVSATDVLMYTHASNISFTNIRLQGANTYCLFSDWNLLSNLKIDNCRMAFAGVNGMYLNGTNGVTVTNTTFNWVNGNGISLDQSSNKLYADNNIFRNIGIFPGMIQSDAAGKYATAVFTQGVDSVTVTNSNFNNIGFIGVNFTMANDVLVQHNDFNNFCTVLADGGAIYAFTGTANTTLFRRYILGNRVLNGQGAPEGTTDAMGYGGQIYSDDNGTNITIAGNTVANGKYPGVYVHNSRGIIIRDNILYNNAGAQIYMQHDVNQPISGCTIRNNQVFALDSTQLLVKLASSLNDFGTFGTWDSNYYCRPFKEASAFYKNYFSGAENNYDLTSWKSFIGSDGSSKKTPISVDSVGQIIFRAAGKLSQKVKVCADCVAVDSSAHNQNIDLSPYSAIILLRKKKLIP